MAAAVGPSLWRSAAGSLPGHPRDQGEPEEVEAWRGTIYGFRGRSKNPPVKKSTYFWDHGLGNIPGRHTLSLSLRLVFQGIPYTLIGKPWREWG